MDTRQVTREMRLQYWAGVLKERQESGQSVRAWCRENEVGEKTYYYWQRRLREAACNELTLRQEQTRSIGPAFAEIKLPACQGAYEGGITVRLREAVIEIAGGAPTATVETVLRILREPC